MKKADIILFNMELDPEMRSELEKAQAARFAGNEGMSRVCARRAAGLAARRFLLAHGVRARRESAYEALQKLAVFPGLPQELKQAAAHLTLRVDGKFSLPEQVDLISEACKLIGGLT